MTDIQAESIPEVTNENVDVLLGEQKAAESVTNEPEIKEEKKEEPKVNLGALHEERARRKALDAENRQLREENARNLAWRQQNEQVLQERLAALQPKTQIDPQENPVEYLASLSKQTQETLEKTQKQNQEQQEREMYSRSMQQFHTFVVSDEVRFKADKPDYDDAVKYAKEFKAKEYKSFGYSDEQAAQMVSNDAFAIAQRALQLQSSPAELAYQYALTIGYTPKVDASKKLDMMEAGQKASKPSGSSGKVGLTLEALAAMSNEDFAKVGDAEFKRLMGG